MSCLGPPISGKAISGNRQVSWVVSQFWEPAHARGSNSRMKEKMRDEEICIDWHPHTDDSVNARRGTHVPKHALSSRPCYLADQDKCVLFPLARGSKAIVPSKGRAIGMSRTGCCLRPCLCAPCHFRLLISACALFYSCGV